MRRRNKPRRVRFKVVARSKQRTRRNQYTGAVLAVAVLFFISIATIRHVVGSLSLSALKSTFSLPPATVEVVSSQETLRDAVARYLAGLDAPAPVAAQAELAQRQFPCIKSVKIRRDWFRRSARLELEPRVAIAAAKLGSRAGYLSDDGFAFEAPKGLYDVESPIVDSAGADAEALRVAAAIVKTTAPEGALPSPLTSLRYSAAQDGWEARLEDGMILLWGDDRWPAQKLARIKEVLADARAQAEPSAPFVTDLRYFEDGKILLRPIPHTLSMR